MKDFARSCVRMRVSCAASHNIDTSTLPSLPTSGGYFLHRKCYSIANSCLVITTCFFMHPPAVHFYQHFFIFVFIRTCISSFFFFKHCRDETSSPCWNPIILLVSRNGSPPALSRNLLSCDPTDWVSVPKSKSLAPLIARCPGRDVNCAPAV